MTVVAKNKQVAASSIASTSASSPSVAIEIGGDNTNTHTNHGIVMRSSSSMSDYDSDITHFEDEHDDHLLPPIIQPAEPAPAVVGNSYSRPTGMISSYGAPSQPYSYGQNGQSESMKSLKSQKSERTVDAVRSAVQLALQKGDTVVTVDMNEYDDFDNNNDTMNDKVVKALQDEMDATDHHLERDLNEYVSIHDDVYNMFFLSHCCGQAFYYAAYVFSLKIALYTFLALDVIDEGIFNAGVGGEVSGKVLAAQCLMLPVAVAMQEDLIATYYLLANIKYCQSVRLKNPDARKWKYNVANFARGLDGMFSLLVNFVVLLKADSILPMFLNFAALQFLQTIDNIALQLAASGFLTERLEEVALAVKDCRLPKKHNVYYKALDSVFFISTVFLLFIAWLLIIFVESTTVMTVVATDDK
jgi:hypothetical protein